MESNISHVFADLFTARPKAYSRAGVNSLLNIRLLKTNGYDLKKVYFDSLKKEEKLKINNEVIKRNISTNQFAKYNDYFNTKMLDSNLSASLNNFETVNF